MIDPGHSRLSIVRQCELVSISRASFYRQPAGESPENLELMRLIDEAFLEMPWYGARQMARHLRRQGLAESHGNQFRFAPGSRSARRAKVTCVGTGRLRNLSRSLAMTATTVALVLLVALVIGTISGMVGIGGGVLVIPVLMFGFGFSQAKANGTSMAMLLPPIGVFAVLSYWRAGNIDFRFAAVLDR